MDTERIDYINGLAQDCSNSIANALELLQSYTKPSRKTHQNKSQQDSVDIQWTISMGQCKKDVTPLLTRWSYIFLALTHPYCSSSHIPHEAELR